MPDADWPRCPSCDRPRTTQCRICHTFGVDFELADPTYMPHLLIDRETCSPSNTSCGGGCCPKPTDTAPTEPPHEPDDVDPPRMLVCPTCDEMFLPEYPRRCEWCDHIFEDGYVVVEKRLEEVEPISGRPLFVLAALAVLGLILAAYFVFLV